MVIVPNTRVASSIVIDFDQPDREVLLTIPFGVGYDSDLAKVEKIALEIARESLKQVPGSVESFEPVVRFTDFGDSSIRFNTVLKVRQFNDQFLVKHEFIKRLHARFAKEGITLPYPVQTVYLKGKED